MKNRIIIKTAILIAIIVWVIFAIKANANSLSGHIITDDDPVPIEVAIACNFWGDQYNICPELLEAIAFHESRFVADAENGTCKGVMQVNTAAHKKRMKKLGVDDVFDINSNVMVAADYLAELFAEYEDVGVVMGIYHGESNAKTRAERGNLSSYVRKILKTSEEYERAHGK